MKQYLAVILCSLVGIPAMGHAVATADADSGVFLFSGYALAPPGVGQTLAVRALLVNRPEIPPPLPLDFAAQEHTVVIEATLATIVPNTHLYTDGTIAIYSDSLSRGSAADYDRPESFVDGELILSGHFDTLGRYTMPPVSNIFGHVVWSGGTRLHELSVPVVLTGVWDSSAPGIPRDYNQAWTGSMQVLIDAIEPRSWSAVRGLYR